MAYSTGERIWNFFSVLIGLFCGALMFILLAYVLFLAGLLVPEESVRFNGSLVPMIAQIFTLASSAYVAGVITIRFTTKRFLLHALITGVVGTFLCLLANKFRFDVNQFNYGLSYFLIIPFTLLPVLIKKRTFQTDIAAL
jgi:hypothetical protein